jgi:hypothetical protein
VGLFLSLSGVIGKSRAEVVLGLQEYLAIKGGGIEEAEIESDHKNFCTIRQEGENTTIFYPNYFFKWDECSQILSKVLKAPVFSLHIYDGDFWTYTLFVEGENKDQFLPIPDYFGEEMSQQEIDSWKGNSDILVKYVPGLTRASVEKYLVTWNLDEEEKKAYEDDEYTCCDEWQLVDFLRKLKLPYPIDDGDPNGKVYNNNGEVYKFWSKDIPIESGIEQSRTDDSPPETEDKPWWRFW